MKLTDINIRDPFVLCDDNKYYLYGTRANDFGVITKGFEFILWLQPLPKKTIFGEHIF